MCVITSGAVYQTYLKKSLVCHVSYQTDVYMFTALTPFLLVCVKSKPSVSHKSIITGLMIILICFIQIMMSLSSEEGILIFLLFVNQICLKNSFVLDLTVCLLTGYIEMCLIRKRWTF